MGVGMRCRVTRTTARRALGGLGLGLGVGAVLLGVTGCAGTPSPAPSPSPSNSAALPPGYVTLSQPGLTMGVPASWIRVGVGAGAAGLRRLESRYPSARSRLISNTAGKQPGRMFAIDPNSASEVLVLAFPTPGIASTRQSLTRVYAVDLKPVFARDRITVLTHHLSRLGGRLALRLTANYLRGGVTVPEVIDLVVGDGKLFDLTFSAAASTVERIESTITVA